MLPTLQDFHFSGFSSTTFPLGSVQSAMTLLFQRVITTSPVTGADPRARVYYNLVVLFRLLWHHRILESAPDFWKQIFTDFPPTCGTADQLQSVVFHYVDAREAFLRKHGTGKDASFLARLVDQWRTRPPVDEDLGRLVRQAAMAYSRKAQEKWAALLRFQRQRLISSKEMNWPVLAYHSLDADKGPLDFLTAALGSNSSSKPKSGSKQSPKALAGPPALNKTTSQAPQHSLPPELPGENDRDAQVQRTSMSSLKSKRKPGRLTPPVELQHGRQTTLALKLAGPHHWNNGGIDRRTREPEPGKPTTPQKRPAPGSHALSPFSKRRLITQAAEMQPNQDGESRPVVVRPFERPQESDGFDESPKRSQQRERVEGLGSQCFGVPCPPVNAQSLGGTIASGADSSTARSGGHHAMPQRSPGLNEGLAFPATDAKGMVTRGGQMPPGAPYHNNPSVLIDVPGSIFAFARRIENLEGIAAGHTARQEAIDTLVRDMAKLEQAVQELRGIRTVVAGLALQIKEFEKAGVARDEVSASVSSTTSALATTIEGLEKQLGEATDTRTTIAALTRRIAELEKVVAERAAVYAAKVTDLETKFEAQSKTLQDMMTTVEMQSKILEELGLKEAGEIVE